MSAYYIHIDGSKKKEFIEELLLHDCIYGNDIEERADDILVLANVSHDFVEHNIDGRKSGAIKVLFYADYYFDQPVTV